MTELYRIIILLTSAKGVEDLQSLAKSILCFLVTPFSANNFLPHSSAHPKDDDTIIALKEAVLSTVSDDWQGSERS